MSLLRRLSIILGLASVIVPGAWACSQLSEASAAAEATRATYGYVCGLGSLVVVSMAALGSAALSGVGAVCGLLAYRSLPSPAGNLRAAELAMIALPLLASGGFFITLLLAG